MTYKDLWWVSWETNTRTWCSGIVPSDQRGSDWGSGRYRYEGDTILTDFTKTRRLKRLGTSATSVGYIFLFLRCLLQHPSRRLKKKGHYHEIHRLPSSRVVLRPTRRRL